MGAIQEIRGVSQSTLDSQTDPSGMLMGVNAALGHADGSGADVDTVYSCSSVTQLAEAEGVSAGYFLVSNPIEGQYFSMKVPISGLVEAVSVSLGIGEIQQAVTQNLSDAVAEDGRWLRVDMDEPYVISAIHESHGVITEVSGLRLSSAVNVTLSNLISVESYVNEMSNPQKVATIHAGGTQCDISVAGATTARYNSFSDEGVISSTFETQAVFNMMSETLYRRWAENTNFNGISSSPKDPSEGFISANQVYLVTRTKVVKDPNATRVEYENGTASYYSINGELTQETVNGWRGI